MAVTVQMQFESAVTELYEDAFIGSSIENGTTIIQFDLRKLDFRDLSRERESSEQFGWLNRRYGETETQLGRSAITPSIRADSSQNEMI